MQTQLRNKLETVIFHIKSHMETIEKDEIDNIPKLKSKLRALEAFETELKSIAQINGYMMGDYKKCSYQGPECLDEASGKRFVGDRCKKCKQHKKLKCITNCYY